MVTHTGTAGNDKLNGSAGSDVLDGLAGNDDLFGQSGDDEIYGGLGNDTIRGGNGFDWLVGDAGSDLIDGGGGIDTVVYSLSTAGVMVNLLTGRANDGMGGLDTLAGVEDARGSLYDDVITGNALDNALMGLSGNDTINGGAGTRDQLRYDRDALYGGTSGVTVNLATGIAIDGFGGTDRISGIERVRGTDYGDTITGDANDNEFRGEAGADSLSGNDGNDYFEAGAGNDTIRGGNDFDELSFYWDGATAGVVVSYAAFFDGTASDGLGGTDRFFGIEAITGTAFADRITGVGQSDTFYGMEGADLLVGNAGDDWLEGGHGADTLDGGLGANDLALYDHDEFSGGTRGVNVNLATGTATDTFGMQDRLIGIESVRATRFNDTLVGNAAANDLFGRGGADSLVGNDGDDYFEAGSGSDTIRGGNGLDVLSYLYDGGTAGVTVTFTAATNATATDGFGATDWIYATESVEGTSFNDTLTGSVGDQILAGHGGNDRLVGNGDDDELDGGAGNDTLDGGAGAFDAARYDLDALFGGAGGVTVDLVFGRATDGFGTQDTLIGIEDVYGTALQDVITGNLAGNSLYGLAGNDRLTGNGGDDYFEAGAGADTVNGGPGLDTLDYQFEGASGGPALAIIVNMLAGTVRDTFGTTDTITGIDRIIGTSGADVMNAAGFTFAVTFSGNSGNDTITGGGGNDLLNGDDAFDRLTGGNGNDTLAGGNGNDSLFGSLGADRLDGGAGNDLLAGDAGNDLLTGGIGADRFEFRPGGGADRATDFLNGTDILAFDDLLWGGAALTAAQVVSTYGTVLSGNAVFDFGNGNLMTIAGVTNLSLLQADIIII